MDKKGKVVLKNTEDRILDYIKMMSEDIDCSNVERIEIIFDGKDIGVDIESIDTEFNIKEFLGWDEEKVELKSMMIALLLTSFKDTSNKYISDIYEVLEYGPKWVDALNMYFDDVAKQNNKSYKIQVMLA